MGSRKSKPFDIHAGKRGSSEWHEPKKEKHWAHSPEKIEFILPTTVKSFWRWFDGVYRKKGGYERTPIDKGLYKVSHPREDLFESKIKAIDEDNGAKVEVEHKSVYGGRWDEELQEQAEDYFAKPLQQLADEEKLDYKESTEESSKQEYPLDKLCVQWVKTAQHIPRIKMKDFLIDLTDDRITIDVFKKAVTSAGKRGLYVKGKNRRWSLP